MQAEFYIQLCAEESGPVIVLQHKVHGHVCILFSPESRTPTCHSSLTLGSNAKLTCIRLIIILSFISSPWKYLGMWTLLKMVTSAVAKLSFTPRKTRRQRSRPSLVGLRGSCCDVSSTSGELCCTCVSPG